MATAYDIDFNTDMDDLLERLCNDNSNSSSSSNAPFPEATTSKAAECNPHSNFHRTSLKSGYDHGCNQKQAPTPLPNAHTPPNFNQQSAVVARNDDTSIMCGCQGRFFWEFLPEHNINYFRGSSPDVVDYCMSSIYVYRTFNDAFWDAYTQCIEYTTRSSSFVCDYTIGVYQLHSESTCPRHYTRYTLGSFKKFMAHNEQLRQTPVVGTFCKCIFNIDPADIAYNVCFTCLQTTLELHALALEGVKLHFTYEANFKTGFLASVQDTMRNTKDYFVAQALFESKIAKNIKIGTGYMNTWKSRGVSWKAQRSITENKSYCIMCQRPGNSQDLFVCPTCTKV